MEKFTTMFRLKLAYKAENDETGAIENVKDEMLVECVNYTDAEKVVMQLEKLYDMSKYEPLSYEIVKCKYDFSTIFLNALVNRENDDNLICGLVDSFIEDKEHGLYAVDIIMYGDKSIKEKDVKETYFIPAINPADAHFRAAKIIQNYGKNKSDYAILNVKHDKANDILLLPSSYAHLNNRSVEIGIAYGLQD